MQIDFLKVWLPPINLWSRPRQIKFDYLEETVKEERSTIEEYWFKKGYEQALKDAQKKLEELASKRKPDKNDVGTW